MSPKNKIRENNRYSPQYTPASKPVGKTFIIIAITVAALVVLGAFLVFTNTFVGEAIKFAPKTTAKPAAPPVKDVGVTQPAKPLGGSSVTQPTTGRETTGTTQISKTTTTTATPKPVTPPAPPPPPVLPPVGTTNAQGSTTIQSSTTQPAPTTNVNSCLSVVSQLSARDKELFCQQAGVSIPVCDVNTCVTVLSEALLLPEDKDAICKQIGASFATAPEVPACQKAKSGNAAEQALLNNIAIALDNPDKLKQLTIMITAINLYASS